MDVLLKKLKQNLLLTMTCMILLILGGVFLYKQIVPAIEVEKKNGDMKVTVHTAILARQDMYREISLFGNTVSDVKVDIAAKYAGRVTAVNVKLGQAVTEGEILLVQDTGDLNISIAQADAEVVQTQTGYNADLLKAEADYERLSKNVERYQKLQELGAISTEELENVEQQMINARAAYAALNEQLVADRNPAVVEYKLKAVSKLEKQREDMILTAPREGIIDYKEVEVGAYVQPGQRLLTLVDNRRLFLDCKVPEQDSSFLSVGMPVDVLIESIGQKVSGSIVFVSSSNDSETKSFMVRIAINPTDFPIKAGMFGSTESKILQKSNTLVAPLESVMEKDGQYFVFIINETGKAEKRKITLGMRNDKEIEIKKGVSDGEKIILDNLSRLNDKIILDEQEVSLSAYLHKDENGGLS